MAHIYGYARVSTKEQKTDRQLDALVERGLSPGDIFTDMQSGKDFERPRYRRLLRALRRGDTVFVKSIDRLGRNYAEILEQWHVITKNIGADIVVLDMPLLDTRKKEKDLTGTFVADLVLQILSYVAQTERENIRRRQAEGIAAAKARGVRFGNPGKPLPEGFEAAARRWRSGEAPLKYVLSELGVGRTYFFERVRELAL